MAVRILYHNLKSLSSSFKVSSFKQNFLVLKLYPSTMFSAISSRNFSVSCPTLQNDPSIEVTFVRASGEKVKAKGKKGDSLLDVIVNNNLDFDAFGACEGTLTCSTCHVILKKEDYDRLPEKPTDEELDMLDLAHGLEDTSRLGCQIILTEDLNGLEVQVPATVNDARERFKIEGGTGIIAYAGWPSWAFFHNHVTLSLVHLKLTSLSERQNFLYQ